MITFIDPHVTIEFFSHRNPRVTYNNTSNDVQLVKVWGGDAGPGNLRRWHPVNFHDCVALRQAINNANITSHRPYWRELQLILNQPETFMGVPLVSKVKLVYMEEPTEHDSLQLDMARIGGHLP